MAMYQLDCGNITAKNLEIFSHKDQYTGESKDLSLSCFLIEKNGKWLLWDTGVPSSAKHTAIEDDNFKTTLDQTLVEQLAQLGLTPNNIDFVILSHLHFDHAANTNMFKKAQLIINRKEFEAAQDPALVEKSHLKPEFISYHADPAHDNRRVLLDGNSDLFGDKSIIALDMPGHTPGHMALMVTLPESGTYVLSGDQWHFHENHASDDAPAFNYNQEQTLESSARLRSFVKAQNATLIIQHEVADKNILPAFPTPIK